MSTINPTGSAGGADLSPSAMNRIYGLGSGMDIDAMVANLMKAARLPLDGLHQQKQIWEWKQDDYRSLNTSLAALRDTVFNLKLQNTFMAKKVASSSEAVTATVTGADTLDISHRVEVSSLAGAAVMAAGGPLATAAGYTEPLNQIFPGLTTDADGKVKILLGDGTSTQEFILDPATQSLNDLISQINAGSLSLKASWDQDQRRFYLTSTKLGQANGVGYTDESGNLMGHLMGTGATHQEAYGSNAQVKIDGISYCFDSNQATVNGISYTFQGLTTTTASITVSDDIDSVLTAIKDFITKYNDTLATVNGKLNEQRYPDYQPLTDDQISAGKLTDTQIDQWQAKAKSGLLQGDELLGSTVSDLRKVISSTVNGLNGKVTVTCGSQQVTTVANQIGVIGITTGTWEEKGKLYLDEAKLRQALQSNPQAVMDFFTKSVDDSGNLINDGNRQGLAIRLYDTLNQAIDQLTAQAGSSADLFDSSSIGRTKRDLDQQINSLNDRLNALENRYYNEFNVMEQAIAQLNSQSAWLSAQFGKGQNG